MAIASTIAVAAAPAARAATLYVDGISDQNMAYWDGDVWRGGAPASPFGRYLSTTLVRSSAIPLRYARYVVAYDVACDEGGPAFATFQAWLADTEALGLEPDVAFWYGDFDGNRCPSLPKIPTSVAEYAAAIAPLLARFPQIRTIEPWNEPNDGHGPDVAPQTAAGFWLAARAACPACAAVIAGDFSDAGRELAVYERAYVDALGAADPLDWGIHPYKSTNDLETAPLVAFEAGLPDPAADRVWYTEVGAYYCTRRRSLATGATDGELEALQLGRARYLVDTLMAPPFSPVHVFYYELMYKDNVPGPCITNDSALFAPGDAARAAAPEILPMAGAAWQIWIPPWWPAPGSTPVR